MTQVLLITTDTVTGQKRTVTNNKRHLKVACKQEQKEITIKIIKYLPCGGVESPPRAFHPALLLHFSVLLAFVTDPVLVHHACFTVHKG